MAEVDSIFLTTTIINSLFNSNKCGTATGFFYALNDKVYLVTNKHVIYGDQFANETAEPIVNKFKLILHTNRNNLAQNEEVEINLLDKKKELWFEHKQKNIDVICIPIELDRRKYIYVSIGDELIDVDNIKIGFERIFVMGYPFGWYDSTFNLPITRIGHLSSPYGIPFNSQPYLLGDVETHKGMSGSPVIMYLKDYITRNDDGGLITNIGTSKIILLGIYSGQPNWQITDTITNDIRSIPHSLSIIWFASLIREIITQQKEVGKNESKN